MFAAASFPYSKHARVTPQRHARVGRVCLHSRAVGMRRPQWHSVVTVLQGWGPWGAARPQMRANSQVMERGVHSMVIDYQHLAKGWSWWWLCSQQGAEMWWWSWVDRTLFSI